MNGLEPKEMSKCIRCNKMKYNIDIYIPVLLFICRIVNICIVINA